MSDGARACSSLESDTGLLDRVASVRVAVSVCSGYATGLIT